MKSFTRIGPKPYSSRVYYVNICILTNVQPSRIKEMPFHSYVEKTNFASETRIIYVNKNLLMYVLDTI